MVVEKRELVRWIDDKGFGFIKPENGEDVIFIHISALRGMSREPVIGDVIHYQISFDAKGKPSAVNAKIEGVSQAFKNIRVKKTIPQPQMKDLTET